MSDEVAPVVVDIGSHTFKAGFAADDDPKVVDLSVVGRNKDPGTGQSFSYVGDEFLRKNRHQKFVLEYPIKDRKIQDHDGLVQILNHIYNELDVDPQDYPMLLTEAPLTPKADREWITKTMFETFKAPAMYLADQAALGLFVSGRITGIVLDVGAGKTHAVPIYERHVLPHAVTSAGTHNLTDFMNDLLRDCGYLMQTSTVERAVVRDIKEKLCYVALDFEMQTLDPTKPKTYERPDGQMITIGNECFRCPERLFKPSLIGAEYETPGVHQAVHEAILKCDIDIRDELYANIVLSGGSTLFPGFYDRLLKEVRDLVSPSVKVKVIAPPERKFSAWKGGSILGSLSSFQTLWISRQEYDEAGPSIVHRKCF